VIGQILINYDIRNDLENQAQLHRLKKGEGHGVAIYSHQRSGSERANLSQLSCNWGGEPVFFLTPLRLAFPTSEESQVPIYCCVNRESY